MKARKPWLAFLMSFVCPGAGQLYNGNLRLALAGLGVSAALSVFGTWLFFDSIHKLLTALALGLVADLVFGLQARAEAKRLGAVALQPYQRWWVYLGFGAVLYGLPGGYGYIIPERFLSFQIPSESMVPTLLVGDRLVADGWSYRSQGPARGEIVTFRYPKDPSVIYVKRVVGLPGDVVEFRAGELYLNGSMVEQARTARPSISANSQYEKSLSAGEQAREADNPLGLREVAPAVEYLETLGSVQHRIYRSQPASLPDFGPVTVPADSYFVLGDNRDRSNDSRFWGYVPKEALVGRMVYIYFSWDGKANALRGDRFGLKVQ